MSAAPSSGPWSQRWAARCWGLLLALLVVAPLLVSRGFSLVGDMVFVPHQPWKDQWLAADGSVPRAVPSDALVSLLETVVPGDLLQKAVLLGLLVAGAWGMARLVAAYGPVAQCCAVSLFVWNPFVYERLAIGDWALLCGYAALPWVVRAAARVRDGVPGALPALGVPVLAASWSSPTGGVLASVVAIAVVLGRPRLRGIAGVVALCLVLNLPWLVPGLLTSGTTPADPSGVAAFAARPDTPLGTLGSLLSFGGLWKTAVAAPGREGWFNALLALLVVAAGVAGLCGRRERRDPTVRSLAVLSVLALLLAWLPSTAYGATWFAWAVVHLPGAGIVRDSAKWVAPFVVLVCLGLAALVARTGALLVARAAPAYSLLAVALLPVAVLPGLAWGEFGRLEPVSYPAEWAAVAQAMTGHGASGQRTVVLPFEVYRRFAWNGERAVLDPAPRYFPGDLVVNDALPVGGGRVVAGESTAAARLASAFASADGSRRSTLAVASALRAEHVSWVLVEKDTPGAADLPRIAGTVLHDGRHLRLVYLGPAGSPQPYAARLVVLTVDGLVGLAGIALLAMAALGRSRGYTAPERS